MCCCALEVKKKDKAHEIPRDGMTIVKGHILNCRMTIKTYKGNWQSPFGICSKMDERSS